jgi:hypothetical protein
MQHHRARRKPSREQAFPSRSVTLSRNLRDQAGALFELCSDQHQEKEMSPWSAAPRSGSMRRLVRRLMMRPRRTAFKSPTTSRTT